jgi:hypothetical protein
MKTARDSSPAFLIRAQTPIALSAAALLLLGTAPLPGQDAQPVAASPSPSPAQLTWQDGARDGCSTENLATQFITNTQTGAVTTNLHRYVQVANCLNFLNSSNQWEASQDLIELQPDGSAAAIHGAARAYFSPNLNTSGAITLVSQSNRVFQTHLLGLYFYDARSGSRQLISGMRDCSAELLPPNQIVYRSAFQSIKADVRFTYTKSATESDVILLERPAPPEAYGMVSSNGTIRLEVWHEYLNPPTPQIKPRILASVTDPALRATMVEPDLVDDTMNFGDLWYPLGRIYFMDEYSNTPTNVAAQIRVADASDPAQIPVAKRWAVSQDGSSTTYLIESVPWLSVKPQLDKLPPAGQGAKLDSPKERMTARAFLAPPKKRFRAARRPIQVASRPYNPRGLCLDYITVSGSGDYTFTNGTTYYFGSSGYFSGNLTFQPNAILKFSSGTYLLGYGSFSFSTDTNSPQTILTSQDDDLFGQSLPFSTGIPTYAASQAVYVYWTSSSVIVSEARIRWAQRGVEFDGNGGEVDNSSLEQCQTGLYGNGSSLVSINNSTQCGVLTPLNDPTEFNGSLTDICSGLDSNGLPYAWENQYFGQFGVDPNADPDGDGLSNLQEYLLGSNPTKAPVADTNGVVRLQVFTPLK